MSVGILLITHGPVGQNMLEVAAEIFQGRVDAPIISLAVENASQREQICGRIQAACDQIHQGQDGVLILTDLYGATPSNLACALSAPYPIITVTGVNLSMLLKVITYARLDLPSLAEKAEEGGHQGIQRTVDHEQTGVIHLE